MNTIHKIAGTIDNAIDLVLGKGFRTSSEQVLKNEASAYVYYILTSRQ